MQKNLRPQKAYKNLDFLNSGDARTVRILAEYYEPKSRFERLKIIDTIVFFGSARITSTAEARQKLKTVKANREEYSLEKYENEFKKASMSLKMGKYYDDTVKLSKMLTEWSRNLSVYEKRFILCSGGGPGIMEAVNKGAHLAKGESIGLNISIPFEQYVNKYVNPDYAFEFHYFFMRKFWFVYLAKALVAFPGGFGTLDELTEVLTLTQTEKIKKKIKIIMYDEEFWKSVINFDKLIEYGMISESDLLLFSFCNTVEDAFEEITTHFKKNYLKELK